LLYTLLGGASAQIGIGAALEVAEGGVAEDLAELATAGLPMLAVPALVIGLLMARRHLLVGLLTGIAAATLLGLALGLIAPGEVFYVDHESFGARGLIVSGIERGIGVSIFTILLMGLVAGLEATGITERLVDMARKRAKSARDVELWTFGTVSAAVLLTTHSTVALLAVGPFTRQAGSRFGINACRRANVLDTTVCTYPFLLPYCIPTILAASMTAGVATMPRLSPFSIGLMNFHSWALLVVIVLAILTGWGRGAIEEGPTGLD
jgi:Na+/H+ antiporter NhaC